MGQRFATVLGNPAVIITLEEYYSVLKRMKDGPADPAQVVKEEPDDDNVTDVSAEPGVADAAPYDGEDETQDEDATTSPQEDATPGAQGEAEAPATPISTKKRRIGASLEELLTQADNLKVCPICWVHHPDFNCPRAAESEALYTALSHLLGGGVAPPADVPMVSASAATGSPVAEAGSGDMDVDTQDQPAAAETQDVTDVEIDDPEATEADEEPPTIVPGPVPKLVLSRKWLRTTCLATSQPPAKVFPFLTWIRMFLLWVSPGSRSQWTFQMFDNLRIRSLSSWSTQLRDRSTQDTLSTRKVKLIGQEAYLR